MRHLLFIRHGETDWNAQRRWQGWTDRPLNELGIAQARARAEALRHDDLGAVAIHTSDLARALETARIIGKALGGEPDPHAGLRERNGGLLEGLSIDEIEDQHPGVLEAWRDGAIEAPPGGETDDEVHYRVLKRLAQAAESASHEETVVVVTHGGVIRIVTDRAEGEGDGHGHGTPNLGGRWFGWRDGRLHMGPSLEPLAGRA